MNVLPFFSTEERTISRSSYANPSGNDDVRPLLERVELLQDVQKAEEQRAAEKVVKHKPARKWLLKNLKK